MTPLPVHELANLFPMMRGEEFADLCDDIRVNGVRDPIVLLDGAILDGRNRYRALLRLREDGAERGPGWGVYEGTPLEEEDLLPDAGAWFESYSPLLHGAPLAFIVSKNLKRRHLSDAQRASVAAKIANLGRGRPSEAAPQLPAGGETENPPIGGISVEQAAGILNVAPRQVERARVVHERGIEDLREALDSGAVAVSIAEQIARLPEERQREAVVERGIVPEGSRAIMASRREPDDSLDYFPTPPWATRALIARVLPQLWVTRIDSAWEPACGEGHIAEVLRETVPIVHATDVFDYGYGRVHDFLSYGTADAPLVDWIVTNPPFGDNALRFVHHALDLAGVGVAMFFRSQWAVEGLKRYEQLFRDRPPTLCAFFVERVNLCKSRWDPEGSTATAYCWLVWMHRQAPRPPFWIPPGCREQLSRPDDVARFTAHPVSQKQHVVCDEPFDPKPGELPGVGQATAPLSVEDDDLTIPAFLRRPLRPSEEARS